MEATLVLGILFFPTSINPLSHSIMTKQDQREVQVPVNWGWLDAHTIASGDNDIDTRTIACGDNNIYMYTMFAKGWL